MTVTPHRARLERAPLYLPQPTTHARSKPSGRAKFIKPSAAPSVEVAVFEVVKQPQLLVQLEQHPEIPVNVQGIDLLLSFA